MFGKTAYIIFILFTTSRGEFAERHQFPFVTSIRNNDTHFCTGSVIDRKWVLTAASCFTNDTDVNELKVYGATLQNSGTNGTVSTVEKIILHPQYSKTFEHVTNNIALIKLAGRGLYWFWQPWIFATKIRPINVDQVEDGKKVVQVGWHTEGDETSTASAMKYIELNTIKDCSCPAAFIDVADTQHANNDHFLDIGAPLVLKSEKRNKLVGILSHSHFCDSRKAKAFTRVESYVVWIKKQTRVNLID